MDDDDLKRIREARLQELAQQGGGGGGGGQQGSEQAERRAAEDEARKSILTQILTPEASDRLGRIALVKADRARELETRLVMMARSGQIRQRVTDDDLRAMLAGANEAQKEEKKIVFQRRKGYESDDDDWD